MPLIKSASKKAIGKNISAEMHAGKPQKQAIAIAMSVARRVRKGSGFYDHLTHKSIQPNEESVKTTGDGFTDSSVPKKPVTDNFYRNVKYKSSYSVKEYNA